MLLHEVIGITYGTIHAVIGIFNKWVNQAVNKPYMLCDSLECDV